MSIELPPLIIDEIKFLKRTNLKENKIDCALFDSWEFFFL